MRRLALLMIFSIVATMTFGCGKTEGEEKSTKEEVTTIQETEEPLETKDDKVDLLEYIDELKRVAYYFNMKESDSEKGNVEQHWKGNGIEINVIKGSSQKLHDYNYPDFQIIVTDNDEISVLGYSLGDEINYYMDPVVEKLGWDVNYDGRLDEKRSVIFTKVADDRILYVSFTSDDKDITQMEIYTDYKEVVNEVVQDKQKELYEKYEKTLYKLQSKDPNQNVEFAKIGNNYYPCMLVWSKESREMKLYYLNKKGKIAHTKAFQSMTYNQDGTVTLVNNIIGNTQIVVCQYKDEKLKVISRIVTDNSGNTKKYLINDNEVTEKEYNKVVNSYKRDNDRYRTYSYNGAEYSGYEDVSHALSALETKIQQIEQAEAEK